MQLKITLLLFVSVLFYNSNYAQSKSFEWATSYGGKTAVQSFSIATDASGNTYSTGFFSDTVDFDPGSGVFNLASIGNTNVFVQKLDSTGAFVWAKSIGGSSNDVGNAITTDNFGNVYLTGTFRGSGDFDPNAGVRALTSQGGTDIFLMKLNQNGSFAWAVSFGGTSRDEGLSLTTDKSGNVYVAGLFSGRVDFNPGPGLGAETSNRNTDAYVVKFDPNGRFQWMNQMGGNSIDQALAISYDPNGYLYTTGRFMSTVDFDPTAGVFNLTGACASLFIQKVDTNGNFQWAKSVTAAGGSAIGLGIASDQNGDCYTAGNFAATPDFNPNAGVFTIASNGNSDAFILKLKSNGDFAWAKGFGGFQSEDCRAICLDNAGYVYAAGKYGSTVDFDPNSGTFNLSSAGGTVDAFIQILDTAGNFVDAKSMGGANSWDDAYSIAADAFGGVYATGYFEDTADFNPNAAIQNLVSKGSNDPFVIKLGKCVTTSSTDTKSICDSFTWLDGKTYTSDNNSATFTLTNAVGCDSVITLNLTIKQSTTYTDMQSACNQYAWIDGKTYTANASGVQHILTNAAGCDSVVTLDLTINKSTTGTDTQTACKSFTWIDGNTYTSNNNSATSTLTNQAGCDSVVTLNLTIENVNTTVTANNTQLTSQATNASYQWVDCNDNYSAVSAATSASFAPASNGDYACIITQGSCTDTSDCFSFNSVGLRAIGSSNSITIAPNPTNGAVRVNFNTLQERSLRLYNTAGALLFEEANFNNMQFDFTIQQSQGVYVLEVESSGSFERYQIIKQ